MNKNARKPNTFEEAMKCFLELLTIEEQIDFTRMTEGDVGSMHHGLGQWLRNNWGLWDENSEMCKHMKSLGFIHADDMSSTLLMEFWRCMNLLPSKLSEDIQYYKEYWEKQNTTSAITLEEITIFNGKNK